jgi:histone-lysine N-methyltransferase SUV420H
MPTPERYQLTLGQLAEFDDLLTDSLVDRVCFARFANSISPRLKRVANRESRRIQVYYWTTIRKMKHTYHPNRGVKTDAVTKIIVNDLVRNKSVASSLQQFLQYGNTCPPPPFNDAPG